MSVNGLGSVTYIGNPIVSVTGKLTSADQIYYKDGKSQADINIDLDGKSIIGVENYYSVYSKNYWDQDSDIYDTLTWVKIPNEDRIPMPETNSTNKYLWNYSEFKYASGESFKTTPTVISVSARSIVKEVYKYMILPPDADDPTVNSDGWEDNSSPTDDINRHLWRLILTEYSNGDTENRVELVGVHGTRGMDGTDIEYVYLLSNEKNDNGEPKRPSTPSAVNNTDSGSLNTESINAGWKDEPEDVKPDIPYLWMSLRKKEPVSKVWSVYSEPTLWAIYGKSIINIVNKYAISNDSENYPSLDSKEIINGVEVSIWKDNSPTVTKDKRYLWKYTKTELSAGDIREEFEMIGAMGEKGIDGDNIEYIYIRTASWDGTDSGRPLINQNGNGPLVDNNDNPYNDNINDFIPKGWSDEQQGVNKDLTYEWYCTRKCIQTIDNNNIWGEFKGPKIWSVYGKDIISETKYYAINNDPINHPDIDPNIAGDTEWLTYSPSTTNDKKYLWEKTITELSGGRTSNPSYKLIGVHGDKGMDGSNVEYIYIAVKDWDGNDDNRPQISNTGKINGLGSDIQKTEFKNYDNIIPENWSDEPVDTSETYKYVFISSRKKSLGSLVWSDFGNVSLWSKYGEKGQPGEYIDYEYDFAVTSSNSISPALIADIKIVGNEAKCYDKNNDNIFNALVVNPEATDIKESIWVNNSPSVSTQYSYLWKRIKMTYINSTKSPETRYEMIGAMGQKGVDGDNVEYAYILRQKFDDSSTDENIKRPVKPTGNISTNTEKGKWTDDAQDVSEEWPFEFCSTRKKASGSNNWEEWCEPFLWSKYGSDGNGIIDIKNWYVTSNDSQNNPDTENGKAAVNPSFINDGNVIWQENSPITSESYKYLWKKTIQYFAKDFLDSSTQTEHSERIVYDMIGVHGQKGIDGDGIDYIFTLSASASAPNAPDIKVPIETNNGYNNGLTVDNNVWYDDAKEPTESLPYLYMAEAKKTNGVWSKYSNVTLWNAYNNGIIETKTAYLICNSSSLSDNIINAFKTDLDKGFPSLPETPAAETWYSASPTTTQDNLYLWKGIYEKYARPMTGVTLDDSTVIKFECLGTGGRNGVDGKEYEYAYIRTWDDDEGIPSSDNTKWGTWPTGNIISNNGQDILAGKISAWTDDKQGVSSEWKCEYEIRRVKENNTWSPWGIEMTKENGSKYYIASLVSRYGIDGASISETVARYKTLNASETPNAYLDFNNEYDPSNPEDEHSYKNYLLTLSNNGWTETAIDKNDKYIYEVKVIKYDNGVYHILGPTLVSSPGKPGKDGSNGESVYAFNLDNSSIIVPIYPASHDKNPLKIITGKTYNVIGRLHLGKSILDNLSSNGYSITATAKNYNIISNTEDSDVTDAPTVVNDGSTTTPKPTDNTPTPTGPIISGTVSTSTKNNYFNIAITTKTNTDENVWIDYVELAVKKSGTTIATSTINITYVQIGEAGKSAEAGKVAYPMGDWDANTTYSQTDYSVPYVHLNGKYYLLKVDSSKNQNPVSNSNVWQEFEQQEAVYTSFLMADNANLGSPNGAIIYDNFMYSQDGLDKTGNSTSYSQILGEGKNIFNREEGKPSELTGEFVPNTYINFYEGEISCNKFSEQYDNFYLWKDNNPSQNTVINTHYMDLDKSHNVIIQPRLHMHIQSGSTNYWVARPGVVVLPDYTASNYYDPDGIHVNIAYPNPGAPGGHLLGCFEDYNSAGLSGYTIKTGNGPGLEGYVIVCADARMFDLNHYTKDEYTYRYNYSNTDDYSNSFVWNGCNCKFVLLCPGSTLKLRSCITGAKLGHGVELNKKRCWIIENSGDFDSIPLQVDINHKNSEIEEKPYICTFDSAMAGYSTSYNFIALGSGKTELDATYGMMNSATVAPPDIINAQTKTLSKSVFCSELMGTTFEISEDGYYTGTYKNPLVLLLDISKTNDNVTMAQNSYIEYTDEDLSIDGVYSGFSTVTTKILSMGGSNQVDLYDSGFRLLGR